MEVGLVPPFGVLQAERLLSNRDEVVELSMSVFTGLE